jgi:hypothetical protein
MHRPGYVQGGQEASIGCLLLGVYYRRIPGSTLKILQFSRKNVLAEQCLVIKNFDLKPDSMNYESATQAKTARRNKSTKVK